MVKRANPFKRRKPKESEFRDASKMLEKISKFLVELFNTK